MRFCSNYRHSVCRSRDTDERRAGLAWTRAISGHTLVHPVRTSKRFDFLAKIYTNCTHLSGTREENCRSNWREVATAVPALGEFIFGRPRREEELFIFSRASFYLGGWYFKNRGGGNRLNLKTLQHWRSVILIIVRVQAGVIMSVFFKFEIIIFRFRNDVAENFPDRVYSNPRVAIFRPEQGRCSCFMAPRGCRCSPALLLDPLRQRVFGVRVDFVIACFNAKIKYIRCSKQPFRNFDPGCTVVHWIIVFLSLSTRRIGNNILHNYKGSRTNSDLYFQNFLSTRVKVMAGTPDRPSKLDNSYCQSVIEHLIIKSIFFYPESAARRPVKRSRETQAVCN